MNKEPRTKNEEQLFACPFCHRSGFTQRGLKSHWCSEAPMSAKLRADLQRPRRLLTEREISACKPLTTPVHEP